MVHEPASWEKLDGLKTLNRRAYQCYKLGTFTNERCNTLENDVH